MNETVITLFGAIDRFWYNKNYLKYFLDKAKDAGVGVVLASAEERAIPLYERMGFARENNNMCICL